MRWIIRLLLLVLYPLVILGWIWPIALGVGLWLDLGVQWQHFLTLLLMPTVQGFFVVPFMYRLRNTPYADLPWWTRLHANLEDWHGTISANGTDSLPRWWIDKHGTGFWSFMRYHALRNSADGLRSFPLLALKVEQENVRAKIWGKALSQYKPDNMEVEGLRWVAYFCWQEGSVKCGFKFVRIWNDKYYTEIKWGWRVKPTDAHARYTFRGRYLKDHLAFTTATRPYRRRK